MAGENPTPRGVAAFTRLARVVVRRPFVPVVGWLVLLAVATPFLAHLGAVTTNSAETIPTSAPSAVAEAKLAELFPGESSTTSSILLFYGSNVTDRSGQDLVMNVTSALRGDPHLADVASIDSVYTAYAAYLAGEAQLTSQLVAGYLAGPSNLSGGVNQTAQLLWGPPALFVQNWEALVAHSGPPANASNLPAYNETATELAGSPASLEVLAAFYGGYHGAPTGFNGTAGDCAAAYGRPGEVNACADAATRSNVAHLSLAGTNGTIDAATLGGLGIENFTNASAQQGVAAAVMAEGSGLPASWFVRVWDEFGGLPASSAASDAYANATVRATTLADEPLPVPLAVSSPFVNPAGTASLISVSFSVAADTTNSSGGQPVYHDLEEIDGVASRLVSSDPGGKIAFYQTGPAPLDQLTSAAIDASLGLVLPLTVGLLLGIAMLYFRSPVAPVVAFAGLAVALLLGIGATVLLGTVVTHIDTTALTLEEVFVLGVGTDYSVFLVARYREELSRGRSSEEAIVAAVTWAGQSIATSGSTAIIVTLALTFSGVALLAQWGMVLAVAILITMLVALTLLPALLQILGPRVFWPYTGARFARSSRSANARAAQGRTYFYRAAALTKRRPGAVVAAVVLVSVPLVAVALQVPVSYDFYGQLPGGHEATAGLAELDQQFGPGYAVPSFALVTFAEPLVVAGVPNATEFEDVNNLTLVASSTPGIDVVHSLVGPFGESLSVWLALGHEPAAVQANALGTLGSYVGKDGETVLFQLQTNATGLSYGAVSAVDSVQSAFSSYAGGHAEVRSLSFGGGAPTIGDLAQETDQATNVMLIAVTVGLILVLLAVLRSWIIALMAVATIGLSISWAWALSDLVLQQFLGVPIFFYVRTILIMLVLGLGIDYNIFVLTRVREERLHGRTAEGATVEAVGRTGSIITAAAVILASAFAAVMVSEFALIRAIGFAVAIAVILDAMVVRTYLVPASLHLLGERVWTFLGRRPGAPRDGTAPPGHPGPGGGPT